MFFTKKQSFLPKNDVFSMISNENLCIGVVFDRFFDEKTTFLAILNTKIMKKIIKIH